MIYIWFSTSAWESRRYVSVIDPDLLKCNIVIVIAQNCNLIVIKQTVIDLCLISTCLHNAGKTRRFSVITLDSFTFHLRLISTHVRFCVQYDRLKKLTAPLKTLLATPLRTGAQWAYVFNCWKPCYGNELKHLEVNIRNIMRLLYVTTHVFISP